VLPCYFLKDDKLQANQTRKQNLEFFKCEGKWSGAAYVISDEEVC